MLAELVGRLSERSPAALLRLCEERKFSGEISFDVGSSKGTIRVVGGFVDDGKSESGSGDAIEAFLAAQEGAFRMRQRLPSPEGGFSHSYLP